MITLTKARADPHWQVCASSQNGRQGKAWNMKSTNKYKSCNVQWACINTLRDKYFTYSMVQGIMAVSISLCMGINSKVISLFIEELFLRWWLMCILTLKLLMWWLLSDLQRIINKFLSRFRQRHSCNQRTGRTINTSK